MMRSLLFWAASAAFVALFALPPAEAQSWCKNKGLSAAERLICRTPALQALDRELNAIFREAIRLTPPGSGVGIRESQHLWLGRRNSCGLDEACIRQAYAKRKTDLRTYIATGNLDTE